MNRRSFITSALAVLGASQTAIIPFGADDEAIARITPSAGQIMAFRFGEWVPILNLAAAKVGEFIYKVSPGTEIVLPLMSEGEHAYGMVTSEAFWMAEERCFASTAESYGTLEELYAAMAKAVAA